jgi:hypothetical protein
VQQLVRDAVLGELGQRQIQLVVVGVQRRQRCRLLLLRRLGGQGPRLAGRLPALRCAAAGALRCAGMGLPAGPAAAVQEQPASPEPLRTCVRLNLDWLSALLWKKAAPSGLITGIQLPAARG